jgi:hypothetical protein
LNFYHLRPQVALNFDDDICRLLQKSIIFVETEDIELDDNEDEMDRIHRGDRRAHVDEADATEPVDNREYLDSIISRFERSPDSNEIAASAGKRKADEDLEDVPPNAVETGDAPEHEAEEERKPKKAKKKVQISYDQYRSITEMLKLFLKQQEDSGPEYRGTLWKDVVAWYLQLYKNDLTDLDAFEKQRKLVNQVIKRMIKVEGAIIEIDSPDLDPETIINEEKLLRLNPSHEGSAL